VSVWEDRRGSELRASKKRKDRVEGIDFGWGGHWGVYFSY